MQYSFSQTFGKGANILQSSPAVSFTSNKQHTSRSRSRSRSRSIGRSRSRSRSRSHNSRSQQQGPNDRSPVIQSFPNPKQPLLNPDISSYIKQIAKETKNYTQYSKNQQNVHRKQQAKIQKQIQHVDGINERMVNLIKELKRDYSLGEKKFGSKTTGLEEFQIGKSIGGVSKQEKRRLDRCQSTSTFKQPQLQFEVKQKQNIKQIYHHQQQQQYHYDRSIISSKTDKLDKKYDQNQNKVKYRTKIQQRLNDIKNISSVNYKQNQYQTTATSIKPIINNKSIYDTNGTNSLSKNIFKAEMFNNNSSKQKQKQIQKQPYRNLVCISDKNAGNSWSQMHYNPVSHKQKQKETEKDRSNGKYKSIAVLRDSKQKQKNNQENSWLKGKVKTIESQMETNYYDQQQYQNQRYPYEINIKPVNKQNQQLNTLSKNKTKQAQQQQTRKKGSICQILFCNDDNNNNNNSEYSNVHDKCNSCGFYKQKDISKDTKGRQFQSMFNSKDMNSCRSIEFQSKIKRIADKIQNYQKKVFKLNNCIENNNQHVQYRNNHLIQKKSIFDDSQSQFQSYSANKFNKDNKQKAYFYKDSSTKIKTKNINVMEKKQNSYYKNITPVQSTSTSIQKIQKKFVNKQNFKFFDDKDSKLTNKSQQKEQKKLSIKPSSSNFQPINLLNETKKSQKSVPSLKQRMSDKLGLSKIASKFAKQISLDEQFRKAKKQFSKLPDQIPGVIQDKWVMLNFALKQQIQQTNLILNWRWNRQIFQLTDEQADPFYSIAVQNLRDYQQIISQIVQSYIARQLHFTQNLLNKLSSSELSQIFPNISSVSLSVSPSNNNINKNNSNNKIKLDQFTTILSNVTKVNHKCRDIYLIFRSLLTYGNGGNTQENNMQAVDKSNEQESVSFGLLIRVFDSAYHQDNRDKTARFKTVKSVLPSSNLMAKNQIESKTMRMKQQH